MKKLYQIRLENGNSVIVQAENIEQAIEYAGLTIDPAENAETIGESDVAKAHLMLVRTGLGPQNYTIRELHSFTCVAALRDDGNFDISLESEEASDEFYQDYPHLSEAVDESVKMGHPLLQDPRGRQLMEEAVDKERTRLLVVGETQLP
jgi:hypothetical protein